MKYEGSGGRGEGDEKQGEGCMGVLRGGEGGGREEGGACRTQERGDVCT